MQKNQVDQGLAFKKRARRRLVGAIALVFLMVIVLPMILKDREENLGQEEAVEIIMPDHEAALSAEEDVAASLAESKKTSKVTEVIEDAPVKAEVIDLPKVESLPKPQPKETLKPAVKTKEVKAVKQVAAKKKPINAVTTKSNQFYVQIGVFSEVANVKKLQSRLDDLGYQSVTENVTTDKGVKTRLRTETFDGRNEAAIALENIKDSGLTGMVVNQK